VNGKNRDLVGMNGKGKPETSSGMRESKMLYFRFIKSIAAYEH